MAAAIPSAGSTTVAGWLNSIGLPQYAAGFAAAGLGPSLAVIAAGRRPLGDSDLLRAGALQGFITSPRPIQAQCFAGKCTFVTLTGGDIRVQWDP